LFLYVQIEHPPLGAAYTTPARLKSLKYFSNFQHNRFKGNRLDEICKRPGEILPPRKPGFGKCGFGPF
jgi:hypothetical protein